MILITGGMGFIGLHTARRFLDVGEDVVVTQFQARREPDFIKDEIGKRVHVEQLDVGQEGALLNVAKKYSVTGIVHLAVPGLGALSAADDYRTNMNGLLNVLEAAREAGVKRLTYASSNAIYGSLPKGPFTEDMPLPVEGTPNATEAYKKAWDILAGHYAARTGLDVVSLRISGIYGPLYHSMANLPSRLCHAAVHGTQPDFSRGGVPFAEDAGDMCYVKDCAAGIQLIQMADKLNHRVYNVSQGKATTNGELAAAVEKAVPGFKVQLQEGKGPRYRENPAGDITRTNADVGYQPKYNIETGVADYVGWLGHNPQ
jgi:UDP-glucose 4-epimerase